jgi:hypothetical protein
MREGLQHHDGNYRFLIIDGKQIIVGTQTLTEHPNHEEMAVLLNIDPAQVKGGYAEIWKQGDMMTFTGGSMTVAPATQEEFEAAKAGEIKVYEASQ